MFPCVYIYVHIRTNVHHISGHSFPGSAVRGAKLERHVGVMSAKIIEFLSPLTRF